MMASIKKYCYFYLLIHIICCKIDKPPVSVNCNKLKTDYLPYILVDMLLRYSISNKLRYRDYVWLPSFNKNYKNPTDFVIPTQAFYILPIWKLRRIINENSPPPILCWPLFLIIKIQKFGKTNTILYKNIQFFDNKVKKKRRYLYLNYTLVIKKCFINW